MAKMEAHLMRMPSKQEVYSENKELVCPKCGGISLNWMVRGKGRRGEKTPWCFRCNMRMPVRGEKGFMRNVKPDEATREILKRLRGLP